MFSVGDPYLCDSASPLSGQRIISQFIICTSPHQPGSQRGTTTGDSKGIMFINKWGWLRARQRLKTCPLSLGNENLIIVFYGIANPYQLVKLSRIAYGGLQHVSCIHYTFHEHCTLIHTIIIAGRWRRLCCAARHGDNLIVINSTIKIIHLSIASH